MNRSYDMEIKIVLVGDSGTGKSSLFSTYIYKSFPELSSSSAFENKDAYIRSMKNVIKLSIWDTSGGSQYDSIRPLAYTRADIFLVCFSLDNPQSFKNATWKWVGEIDNYNPNALKLFVCTKMDTGLNQFATINFKTKPAFPLFMLERKVAAMGYQLVSCSSVSLQGVEQCFNIAAELVARKVYKNQINNNNTIVLEECQLI